MPKEKQNGSVKATKVQLRLRPAEKAIIARAAELRRGAASEPGATFYQDPGKSPAESSATAPPPQTGPSTPAEAAPNRPPPRSSRP